MIIQSFGFNGQQPNPDAVWVADVRDIDSSVVAGMEDRTGLDPVLYERIMAQPAAEAWVRKFEFDVMSEVAAGDLIQVGCAEGQHRSVAVAEAFALAASNAVLEVQVEHLDLGRDTAETMSDMSVTQLSNRKWYEIKNATEGVAEIYIYEQIGEDYWAEGVTAVNFVNELNTVTAREIHLHINSPGGSVFDGVAIHNALKRHPAKVITYVDGLAASIASIIAIAGDQVVMASNALFMIHNPWGGVQGDAAEMRKMAEVLDKIGETLVNAYEERTGMDRQTIIDAMNDETWYTADEALAVGFIDEVAGAIRAAASFDLSRFRHAPKAELVQPSEEVEPIEVPEVLATVGATAADESDGASGHVSPEAYVPGFGFQSFKTNA